MKWIELRSEEQLAEIAAESQKTPVLIFKHSTRCATSRMSLDRLERSWREGAEHIRAYFLDLLRYRPVSNLIASVFDVAHESPQILLIYRGVSILHRSHFEIDYQEIVRTIKSEIPHSG